MFLHEDDYRGSDNGSNHLRGEMSVMKISFLFKCPLNTAPPFCVFRTDVFLTTRSAQGVIHAG
jgi:hypothetical protein